MYMYVPGWASPVETNLHPFLRIIVNTVGNSTKMWRVHIEGEGMLCDCMVWCEHSKEPIPGHQASLSSCMRGFAWCCEPCPSPKRRTGKWAWHAVTSGRKTEPSKPSTHTLGYYIAAEYSIFTWRARLWLAEETDAGALSDEHTVRYRHLQECMAHGKHDMTRETQRYKMHTNLTLGLTF